eukprot:1123341-Prorocentrum_minimum.AAC.1
MARRRPAAPANIAPLGWCSPSSTLSCRDESVTPPTPGTASERDVSVTSPTPGTASERDVSVTVPRPGT